MRQDVLKTGLNALYYSGTHRVIAPFTRGLGLIYMLHRVSPEPQPAFAPNGFLTVSPDFLDAVIAQAREADLDIVTLDEARERIAAGGTGRRFVCFTLDDGYRDNRDHALPVFRRHGAPFTVYVPSDFADGTGEPWWLALEAAVAGSDGLEVTLDGEEVRLAARTPRQKQAAFDRLQRWLRETDEDRQRAFMRDLCARHGLDQAALCREAIMSWDELREFARDPLVTIGAHTTGHFALAKLPEARARREMQYGAERVAAELGAWPAHLSYPYGDAASAGPREFRIAGELGFKTAVTTRKGVLFPDHAGHLTALPRVSLNGAFQSLVYTGLYLTGAPFALWQGFRKLDVA